MCAREALAEHEKRVADPEVTSDHVKLRAACEQLEAAQADLNGLYVRWEALEGGPILREELAVLLRHLESLDLVKSIVNVNGYVNAMPGFLDSPKVINGASDLFVEVWGEAGRHVRAAVGVSSLPRNALVEVQMTVEV